MIFKTIVLTIIKFGCMQFCINSSVVSLICVTGVSGSGATSEYVRQELRAVVGARTGQTQATPPGRPSSQMMNQVSPDLDPLGMNFDMSTPGKDRIFCFLFRLVIRVCVCDCV